MLKHVNKVVDWLKQFWPILRAIELGEMAWGFWERIPGVAKHSLGYGLSWVFFSFGWTLVSSLANYRTRNWPTVLLIGFALATITWAIIEALRFRVMQRAIAVATGRSSEGAGEITITAPVYVPEDHATGLRGDLSVRKIEKAPYANVVFDGFSPVEDQPITWARQTIDKPTLAEFARLRFVNELDEPSADTEVPNLHAVIDIGGMLIVPDGRWADNPDRGTAPSRDVKSTNLPSTGETRILDIAMRPHGFNDCYGWDHNGRVIPSPPIPTGTHRVSIELTGSNMKRLTFEFILDNPLGRTTESVIESSYIELVEPLGSANPCSSRRTRERKPELIGKLQEFVPTGNGLLEMYGRPETGLGLRGLSDIGDWLRRADHAIDLRCPDYLADFRNDGVDIFKGKIVSIELLQGRLARLVEIIKEIRQR